MPGYDANIYKSIRNLLNVAVLPVSELNALNVLRPRRLLLTTSALDAIRSKVSDHKASESQEAPKAEKPAGSGDN